MESVFSYEKSSDVDYYQVLGCAENSSKEQIVAEFKARVLDVHPDKNPQDPHAEKRFKLLQLAKNVLVDPAMRRRYDTWKSSGMAMPFESWTALGKNARTSMHWVNYRIGKDQMLEAGPTAVRSDVTTVAPSSSTQQHAEQTTNRVGAQKDADHDPRTAYWQRDPCPNAALQRFRNYEI